MHLTVLVPVASVSFDVRWEAFKQLRQKVEDFQIILPLLQELSKESIKRRHWEEIVHICGGTFPCTSIHER